MHINITDNSEKKLFDIDEDTRKYILKIADIKLYEKDDDNILLIGRKSKDKIEKKDIITYQYSNDIIKTYNIAGFIGINDTILTIKSRFTEDKDNNNNDYFLHYMLAKVLNINMTTLQHNINYDSLFSFLPYLFNYYLKNALSTGVYKQYIRKEYNDSRVKGSIDFARHIKHNFIENYRVAYNTREHSYDNNINQLIRHTIEYIKERREYVFIFDNSEIKELIRNIEHVTPTYSKNKRNDIINKNLKMHAHPYYLEYEPLRKLCLQILRHDKIKYGIEKDKIYGILFDVSFLWEEYIAIFLKKLNFYHPINSTGKGAVKILNTTPNWECYPDFYNHKIVIDTKYKKMKNMDNVNTRDRYQILSYMYILGLKNSMFVHPASEEKECIQTALNSKLNENINGCSTGIYHFKIPQHISSMDEFQIRIKESEENFYNFIKSAYTG